MLNLDYTPIKDTDGVSEINLRDLFKKYYVELPWLVECQNCIYLITNLINLKRYVGKASYFYGRLVSYGHSHLNELWDPENDLVLNRALRKYKPKNFKIEVIEKDIPKEYLNDREIHWIKYFNTYVKVKGNWGYNMTPGGNSSDQMHTKEAVRKRVKTNIEWYGNPWGAAHTKESRDKARATIAEFYGGDPYGQIHTKESRFNKVISDKANHGGVLAIHTEDSRRWASVSRVRNNNLYRFNKLKESGLPWTLENFLKMILDDHPWRQIETLLSKLPDIVYYELLPDEYEMYKIIYESCMREYPEWTINYLNHNPFEQFE